MGKLLHWGCLVGNTLVSSAGNTSKKIIVFVVWIFHGVTRFTVTGKWVTQVAIYCTNRQNTSRCNAPYQCCSILHVVGHCGQVGEDFIESISIKERLFNRLMRHLGYEEGPIFLQNLRPLNCHLYVNLCILQINLYCTINKPLLAFCFYLKYRVRKFNSWDVGRCGGQRDDWYIQLRKVKGLFSHLRWKFILNFLSFPPECAHRTMPDSRGPGYE